MPSLQPEPSNVKVASDHPFFALIREAYRVFDYQRPRSTGVCVGCCMDANIEADFFKPNIEDLPLAYVQEWFQAACAPGEMPKETWAYLLPRILEILAADEHPSTIGLEVSLNRFETGNPQNWSAKEWSVLDKFQMVYLQREIERCYKFLDDTVCMFSLAGWPVQTLLKQVADAPDDVLARRLWHDWCRPLPGRQSVWISGFWECPGDSLTFDFYTSTEMHRKMKNLALDKGSTPEVAAKASAIVDVIEANARWL